MLQSAYEAMTFILAAAALIALLSIVYVSWRNGISPMPASNRVCRTVVQELRRLEPAGQGRIVEAGSGWGTLALYLVRHCPDWRITGVENSPVPLWFARISRRLLLRTDMASLERLHYLRGDLYDYPYRADDTVICYLYPGAMKRLSTLLGPRLEEGAKMISICFALPDRQPERVITCDDVYRTKIYVYEPTLRQP